MWIYVFICNTFLKAFSSFPFWFQNLYWEYGNEGRKLICVNLIFFLNPNTMVKTPPLCFFAFIFKRFTLGSPNYRNFSIKALHCLVNALDIIWNFFFNVIDFLKISEKCGFWNFQAVALPVPSRQIQAKKSIIHCF